MAEVFGVVAAATQLAGACLGLIELTAKIKGATSMLLRYQNQFQELRDLSLSISKNPLLQTDEVFSHTQSLLLFIQHISLEPLLRKGLVSRTWGLLRREQYLAETSKSLEQRKSSLSLIISDIQARALYEIRTDLRLISDCGTEATLCEYQPDKPLVTDFFDEKPTYPTTTTMSQQASNQGRKREPQLRPGNQSQISPERQSSSVSDDSDNEEINTSSDLKKAMYRKAKRDLDKMTMYAEQKVGQGVDQLNVMEPLEDGSYKPGPYSWVDNVKTGTGIQYNTGDGAYTYNDDGSPVPAGPASVPRGTTYRLFAGNEHRGRAPDDTSTGPMVQLNGPRLPAWYNPHALAQAPNQGQSPAPPQPPQE